MVDCVGGPRVNPIIYIQSVSPRISNDLPKQTKKQPPRLSLQQLQRRTLVMAANRDHPDAFPQNTIVVAVDNAQVAAPCLSITKETPSDGDIP